MQPLPPVESMSGTRERALAVAGWIVAGVIFMGPVICESLAQESAGSREQAARLTVAAMAVAAVVLLVFAACWRRVTRSLGNDGLATIASLAGLQFAVSYAAQIVGYAAGALVGTVLRVCRRDRQQGAVVPVSGNPDCAIAATGVLALALLTLFTLNVITSGQIGMLALLFIAVSTGLHELLAAAFGLTTARAARSAGQRRDGSFIIRAGLAIGLANALALYLQYALYELMLRLYFDEWYKLAVAVVTGFVFGGVGAGCGAALGLRLRRTAP